MTRISPKTLVDKAIETMQTALLSTVRLYTFYTPISKGKYRISMIAQKLFKRVPEGLLARTKDGRLLSVNLASGMQTTTFFVGEYERAMTALAERLIIENHCKTFVDVGANFGWYTTLFYKYAGAEGSVHAFEPVPSIFDNLNRNFELMGSPSNVKINRSALGDRKKEITINLFEGLPTGHASLSDQGRSDAIGFKCQMTTLESYLMENHVGDVDFVKVDIEGAELSFLNGAGPLFRQAKPPIILMEMALNQTRNFGYLPNDLIEFIGHRADYEFYKIDEITSDLIKIEGFEPEEIGANVICIPPERQRPLD